MKKRILSLALAIAICLSLIPSAAVSASAAANELTELKLNIKMPVGGEKYDYNGYDDVTLDPGSKYRVVSTMWTDKEESRVGVFEPGENYCFYAKIAVDSDVTIPDWDRIKVSVSGTELDPSMRVPYYPSADKTPGTYYLGMRDGTMEFYYITTASGVKHEHLWATEWTSDYAHHWHECMNPDCPITETSDKDGYALHTFDNDEDPDCNICGFTRDVNSELFTVDDQGIMTPTPYCLTKEKVVIPASLGDRNFADGTLELASGTFNGDHYLKELILENGITKIPNGMLSNCINVKQLRIPASVSDVMYMIAVNSGVESLILEDGVTKVDDYAFTGMEKMVNLYLPKTVLFYENNQLFLGCKALKRINYGGTQEQWAELIAGHDEYFDHSIQVNFNAKPVNIIDSMHFDMKPIEANNLLPSLTVNTDAGYQILNQTWEGHVDDTGMVYPSENYMVTFIVEAKEGYEFKGFFENNPQRTSSIAIEVGGQVMTLFNPSDSAEMQPGQYQWTRLTDENAPLGQMELKIMFRSPDPEPGIIIDSMHFDIDPFYIGFSLPNLTEDPNAGYQILNQIWKGHSDDIGNVLPGQNYTASIIVEAKEGYEFKGFRENDPEQISSITIEVGDQVMTLFNPSDSAEMQPGQYQWTRLTDENAPLGQLELKIMFRSPDPEPTEPTEPADPTDPTEPTDPTDPVANPFTDVTEEDYFYSPVLWAVEKGITSGTSDTTFSPRMNCSRAQAVFFLWRLAGSPESMSAKNPFSDINPGDYYYEAVLWAVEQGITSGTSDTTFSPERVCTRAQAMTFLWAANGRPAPKNGQIPFSDVHESDYFREAILWAVENGIASGTGDGKFSPWSECARCEMMTFLWKAEGSPEIAVKK